MKAASSVKLVYVFLFWLIVATGCEYDVHDPANYPYKFEQVRRFKADVQQVELYRSPELDTDYILTVRFKRNFESRERYLQVENPLGQQVLFRYNLELPTKRGDAPDYHWHAIWSDSTDNAWGFYTVETDTSNTLFTIDLSNKDIYTLLHAPSWTSTPDSNYTPQLSAHNPFRTDEYGYLIALYKEIKPYHWITNFSVLDNGHTTTLFETYTAVQLIPRFYLHSSVDQQPYLICYSSAPNNGAGNDIFSDSLAYVARMNLDGTIGWILNTGSGGGTAECYLDGQDLLVFHTSAAFDTLKETRIWRVNPEDGSVLDSLVLKDQYSYKRISNTDPPVIINNLATSYITQHRKIGNYDVIDPPEIQYKTGSPYFTIRNATDLKDQEYYLLDEYGNSYMLDRNMRVLAYISERVMMRMNRAGFIELIDGKYLTAYDDEDLVLLELKENKYFSWWFRRYWRPLFFAGLLPALIALAILAYKHRRLRRRTSAKERKLTRELVRQETALRDQYSTRLHTEICGGLARAIAHLRSAATEMDISLPDSFIRGMTEIRDADRMVRDISHEQVPVAARKKYAEMLQMLAEQYQPFYDVHLELDSTDYDVPQSLKLDLYYVLVDALVNIQRHAQAESIRISSMLKSDHLIVQVEDDGVGIRGRDIRKTNSLGLTLMRRRMESRGGTVTIKRVRSGGTRVELNLPVQVSPSDQSGKHVLQAQVSTRM